MAEAIGLGSSVVAFIGLAGQVAQGCQYIRTLLDDIRDASEDLQSLRTEVKIFQLTLETFRNTLEEIADSGVAVEADGQALATKLALSYSEEALELLQGLLARRKDTGRIWGKIRFASGKSKCAKHVSRIERAKGYIEAAHAGILLSLQHQQKLDTRAAHRSLSALTSNLDTTTATISTLPLRFDEVSSVTKNTNQTVSQLRSEFSQRLHDLSTGINAILMSNFTAFTSIISETHSRVEEVYHRAQDTQTAIQGLRSVSEGMRWLPMGMVEVVKEAFRDVLVQFYEERRTLQGQIVGQKDTVGRYQLPSRGQSTRRVVSQHTSIRTYIRAVGIITVHSITTTLCERDGLGTDDPITSTVTHTNIDLNPNPELLRMGVYCSFVQQGFALYNTHPEPILRVYNIVDTGAMIVKACTAGDLLTVQSLFTSGQASPFDRIWGDRSLLDLIQMQVISIISSHSPETSRQRLPGLVATYAELVRCGLDPGAPRANTDMYERSPLSALSNLHIMSPNDSHYIVLLARVMITTSIQDPLLGADMERLVWQEKIAGRKMPLYELLRTQEEWPISWPCDDEVLVAYCSELHRAFHSDYGYKERAFDLVWFEYGEICCLVNPAPFRFLLQICQDLYESLSILNRILRLVVGHDIPGGQKLDEDSTDRLRDRIRECLNSCLEHGLDVDNPPLRLHDILKDFRRSGKVNMIDSAMLSLGITRELANELLEAELYSSMAYQLYWLGAEPSISRGQRGHNWNFIPQELGYTSSPDDYGWSGYLKTFTTMSEVSQTGVTPVENMTNQELSQEDLSGEDISYEQMSDNEMSHESQSDEDTDTSDEDASDGDMYFLRDLIRRGYVKNLYKCENVLVDVTLDQALLELDAFSIEKPSLAVEEFPTGVWQGFNAMSVEEPLEPPDSKQNPELLTELRHSRSSSIISAKVGEDDASSTWSELLDSLDAEYRDDLQETRNIFKQESEIPSTYEKVATAYGFGIDMTIDTPEEDADSDDSFQGRLDGITLALNSFWT